jgi:hypothetical protein
MPLAVLAQPSFISMDGVLPGRATASIRSIGRFSACSRAPVHASPNVSMSAAVERIDPAPINASTSQSGTRSRAPLSPSFMRCN